MYVHIQAHWSRIFVLYFNDSNIWQLIFSSLRQAQTVTRVSLPSNIITNSFYWSDVSKWRRVKELIMDSCYQWDDIRRFSILNVLMKRFPIRNAKSSLFLSTNALTFCRDTGVACRGAGGEKKVLVKCKHKNDKSLLIRLNGKIIHSKCYCKVLFEFLVLCSWGPLRPMHHRQRR